MKMKKIVLLLSMFVLMFSMTACSDGQEKVDFDYTDVEIISNSVYLTYNIQNVDEATKIVINNAEGQEVYQTAISNFEAANEECGELQGFRSKDNKVISLMEIAMASSESEEVFKQYLLDIDSEVEEEGATVRVTLTAAYEDRDAKMSFVYKSAPEQTSVDETTGEVVVPFQISEVTVSPEYTKGEKMAKAGMNTLMGMGTVFVILIFIALIIGQFGRLSKAIMAVSDAIANMIANMKEKRAAKKAAKQNTTENIEEAAPAGNVTAPVTAVPAGDNLMNDAQLVAVITAAIMAAEGSTVSAGSDGLIVRSIKKAKR